MTALPVLTASDVASKIRDLPTLPVIVTELLSTIDRDDVDIHTLADKISHDQALAAKTLRLSNSSFYGMPRKVTTISQAISILGFKNVRTLVAAAAITGNFPAAAQGTFDFRSFWKHSLGAAVCAKALAQRMRLNEEHAFLCGLLHDIGRLVLAFGFPQHHAAVAAYRDEHDCYPYEAEREILGIDHAAIGRSLAEHWKFPAPIQEAIASHHIDMQDSGSLAAVSQLADVIAHALDLSGDERDLVPPLSEKAWEAFALSEASAMEIFSESEAHFEEISRILMN